MLLQLLFVLAAIIVGARLGGIGLGVMGGVGLAILTFVFGLQPTAPPIDVNYNQGSENGPSSSQHLFRVLPPLSVS